MSHRGSPGSLRQFPIHGAEKGGQRQISMVKGASYLDLAMNGDRLNMYICNYECINVYKHIYLSIYLICLSINLSDPSDQSVCLSLSLIYIYLYTHRYILVLVLYIYMERS